MSTANEFSILPATASDIKVLTDIAIASFHNDRNTQFKTAGKSAEEALEIIGLGYAFENWIKSPSCFILKAVDNATGEIQGGVTWGFRGFEEYTNPNSQTTKKNADAQERKESNDPIQRLSQLTSNDLQRWQQKIMPSGTKCMFICSIFVHPKYQGRGIGKELIRWGTRRADKDGVFCWVHSSEAGYPVFAKEGFEEVERLAINLDEFAIDPERSGKVWGEYIFRYMVRQPVK